MNQMDGLTKDLAETNMTKLRTIFPECFEEGKLDIDKLLSLCGEYIDNDFEKYKFEWKGKADCLRLAQKRSIATLRPCEAESVDFENTQNVYIEGDNLEVLKLLQTSYYGKVKMIYIDPPYNTGNDFVYEDHFADPLARYKEVTNQTTKSNPETMGRYHTNWLNMMYPRLRLASNLLRDDGVIFISIDDNEVFNLKKVCDEVFGEENFVASFVWQKKYGPANDAKNVSSTHEYILLYAKQLSEWKTGLLPRNDEQLKAFKNPDNDPRGLWRASDLSARTYSANCDYEIISPAGQKFFPPPSRAWIINKQTYLDLLGDNRISFGVNGTGRPMQKKFLSEVKDGITPETGLDRAKCDDNKIARYELKEIFPENIFDTPKPIKLILHFMKISNLGHNDIILDFFSGSATTAHAVMQLNAEDGGNRQYIMVQLPEATDEKSEAFKAGYRNICEIGKERIRRAGAQIQEKYAQIQMNDAEHAPLDVGFKVFKLDSSNLKAWDASALMDTQVDFLQQRMHDMIDRVKPDRSDLDMIVEVALKLGFPLTTKIEKEQIGTKAVYLVGELGELLVCLANELQPTEIETMASYAPGQIVIARDSFKDDTAIANAHYILQDRGIAFKLV